MRDENVYIFGDITGKGADIASACLSLLRGRKIFLQFPDKGRTALTEPIPSRNENRLFGKHNYM